MRILFGKLTMVTEIVFPSAAQMTAIGKNHAAAGGHWATENRRQTHTQSISV
jgi:hypothetical protein